MSENEAGFDDLDGIVPDHLVDDVYKCQVSEASIVKSKKDGRRWFIIKWEVVEPDKYAGWDLSDVFQVANSAEYEAADAKNKTNIRHDRDGRNKRLMQLGIPRDQLNKVGADPDALVGILAYLTVTTRPKKDIAAGYNVWINNVQLTSSVDESLLDQTNF